VAARLGRTHRMRVKWRRGGVSGDIIDRRGSTLGRGGLGLGLGGMLILGVLSLVFKTDLFALLGSTDQGVPSDAPAGPVAQTPEEEERVQFVSFVLDDLQAVWTETLGRSDREYPRAKLVLFRDATRSACGVGQSATGPFYCPPDRMVYLDLGFFEELHRRFGAPGEFAQAYVIAHEIGHHVQNVLGVADQVREQQAARPSERNTLSVRMELMADCLAGVWAHSTQQRQLLEKGDVESAIGAAAAIGDDRLQRAGGGAVSPDSFTHGSSEQRVAWFRRGLDQGRPADCDTFAARE
jgi:uncharacterized protein